MRKGRAVRKGTYLLIFDMPETEMEVGALGIMRFEEGTYCYVGSAMSGLDQRISRHMSKDKKLRWHIDYLTMRGGNMTAYESANGEDECELGRIVEESGGSGCIKGFGCSDCRCSTHLFLLNQASRERICADARFTPYAQPLVGR
ncbi:MAG: GIY-YIG nuclease family protein [Candidatus Methanoplasma sp.]|jgi:Uri superfamily endonuclease|nr:GIY-YIG nuclease family protein [Candidatus Methanoplasma sp.]